jgi:hypothetical protein
MDSVVKNTNFITHFLLAVIALLASCCLISVVSPQPPVEIIRQYQETIFSARQQRAPRYAPEYYKFAIHSWELAYAEWRQQNKKIGITRNFAKTDSLMRLAAVDAAKAIHVAEVRQDSLARYAADRLAFLAGYRAKIRTDMERIAIQGSNRKKFVQGELLVLQGQEAFERNDYLAAADKIDAGERLLQQVEKATREKYENYMADLPKWQQWARETIERSRENGQVAIIVEKLRSRCSLYAYGELMREFAAEFGPEWVGHKKQQGDDTTPEGQYFVTKKKGPAMTIYHKAVEISYPNEQDLIKFQEAKRAGLIAENASIGGLIEIHGHGGKGVNWTNGCVALKNEDMDVVFDYTKIGTPVTIIGMIQRQ